MEEEEGESYLADLNKAPDFIDEAPIEAPEVRHPVQFFIQSSGTYSVDRLQFSQTTPEAIKTT